MIIGYARTSTAHKVAGFEAQVKELRLASCEKLFQEQASSCSPRAQLREALEFVRADDVLVVTRLDRLARSVADLMGIIDVLEQKRVGLRILNLGMDTQTPTGRLMLTVLGGVAQFEREVMWSVSVRESPKRRRQGNTKDVNRWRATRDRKSFALAAEGLTKTRIAHQLNLGEATVYRILATARREAARA